MSILRPMAARSVVFVFLLLSTGTGALAQSTPIAPDAGTSGAFQLVDDTGNALADIAVTDVMDPFGDVASGYEAAAGSRLVAVAASITNSGSVAFEVRPNYFGLQDADGVLWRQTSVSLLDEPVIPTMGQVRIAPGDRITGLLIFEIPVQTGLGSLVYQPESSRMLTVGALGQAADPPPGVGTQVEVNDVEAGTDALLTVVEMVDPFEDYADGYEPDAGSRYVMVTISVENVGTAPLSVSASNFSLRDGQGYLLSPARVGRGEDIIVPDLQSQTLAPGNRISGMLFFHLEMPAQVSDIFYQPVSGRVVALASPGASTDAPPATPAA